MRIYRDSIRQRAALDYTPAQIDAWIEINVPLWTERRANQLTWIVEVEGDAAGFAGFEPDGHLDMLYVDPRFHGRGSAGLLLATVEWEAIRLGLGRIYTEASLTARPFFEKHGFKLIAAQSVRVGDQHLRNFRMEKPLPSSAGPRSQSRATDSGPLA